MLQFLKNIFTTCTVIVVIDEKQYKVIGKNF
jgi:hypothetical protein